MEFDLSKEDPAEAQKLMADYMRLRMQAVKELGSAGIYQPVLPVAFEKMNQLEKHHWGKILEDYESLIAARMLQITEKGS